VGKNHICAAGVFAALIAAVQAGPAYSFSEGMSLADKLNVVRAAISSPEIKPPEIKPIEMKLAQWYNWGNWRNWGNY
jgi:hypothetical protein